MQILFLSPAFPPTARDFCAALAKHGVSVLGIGDEPLQADSVEARKLTHYVFEPRMGEYQVLHDAVRALADRFGRIDRVDSNGEHWLVAEAKLRGDFGIPGLSSAELARQRSKLSMADLFARADIAYPPTVSAADATAVRKLASKYGFPLVLKPDTGSGAVDTLSVHNEGELNAELEREPFSKVAQPFVDAEIITYDGLTDRDGQIIFSAAHVYDQGIMQVRRHQADGYYYSLRELPPGLEAAGRRAVAAFGVQERFFHIEFFRFPDGGLTALEMNLRPPGGFSTDMMSAAAEVDIYDLWARMMTGERIAPRPFAPPFYTAHAGRRAGRKYAFTTEQLRAAVGDALFSERPVPPAFTATMGDVAYLLRHRELESLKRAIACVQAPG
jgi:glutathione synthase/RimK-type ligase-like ATP-grasp enzyme